MEPNGEISLAAEILRQKKAEAREKAICPRCYINGGLHIKPKENGFCPSCGGRVQLDSGGEK